MESFALSQLKKKNQVCFVLHCMASKIRVFSVFFIIRSIHSYNKCFEHKSGWQEANYSEESNFSRSIQLELKIFINMSQNTKKYWKKLSDFFSILHDAKYSISFDFLLFIFRMWQKTVSSQINRVVFKLREVLEELFKSWQLQFFKLKYSLTLRQAPQYILYRAKVAKTILDETKLFWIFQKRNESESKTLDNKICEAMWI